MKVMRKESNAASDVKIKVSSLLKPRIFIFVALFILAVFLSACSNSTSPVDTGYKIGDTGPAGGIVFYDKGYYSDTNYSLGSDDYTINWRYMEAAPASTEFEAEWGPQIINVESIGDASLLTFPDVGNGKRNTQIIVNSFADEGLSGADYAAQQCLSLSVGTYNDWFLPSNDELGWMYSNLKTANIGGFSNEVYWSSTQENTALAHTTDFSNGDYKINYPKDGTHFVRAVRYF